MIRIDLHLHTTRYSACSLLEPRELAAAARASGLDGVIITEHGRVWSEAELEELRSGAGDLLILAGQEVRTRLPDRSPADLLVFGSEREFSTLISPAELLEAVHRDGGVVVAAHPYRAGLGLGDLARTLDLDGIETLSGNSSLRENGEAGRAARERGLPALGGSDAHEVGRVGFYATEFAGTVTSINDIISLIRQNACRPVRLVP